MPSNVITLPRSQLYELVWSRPVTELAKEFGISDVALAKRCRAIRIPLPPRGHWARVAAGQKPRRPPLPLFRDPRARRNPARPTTDTPSSTPDEPIVTFDPDRTSPPIEIVDTELAAPAVPPTIDLVGALPIVLRTARHLRHPRRDDFVLPRGETQGPILRLVVTEPALDRALLVADRFLRACDEQGWRPILPKEPEPPDPRHYYGRPPEPRPRTGPRYVDLNVDGWRIEFTIEERCDYRALPPTAADIARKKKYPYLRLERRFETIGTGRLRLKRASYRYPYHIDGKSWFETANRRLDDLIPKVLADFRAVATRMREFDEQRARQERERQRLAQLAASLAARREANQPLIQELERQAGAWSRAQLLRRYVRAARRALGTAMVTSELAGESVDFLAWAEHYVNQLDPLHPEPRDPDLAHESDFRYGADNEHHAEEQRRLSGHDWEKADKLVAPNTSGP